MKNVWFWVLLVMSLANAPFALKGDLVSGILVIAGAFLAGWMMGEEDGHR